MGLKNPDDHKMAALEGLGMLDEMAVRQEGNKLWQYLAAVSASILACGVGTALAWTSPILPKMYEPDYFLVITEEQGSWVSSLLAIGAMIGALPAGKVADRIGRKKAILGLSAPFLVSWAMIFFASNVWVLYIARFISGLSVGASCVLVPSYISEVAEISVKGTLGAMFQLFLTVGIVLAFSTGSAMGYSGFTTVCAVVEIVFIATFIWMPESPVWLVGQKRNAEAFDALTVLRGDVYDVASELADLKKEAEENSSRSSSIFDLVKTRGARRAILGTLGGMIFQQLSGINAVIFYTVSIFQAAGSSMDPALAAIMVAAVQMIMSIVAALIVDKAGRKPLLMVSSAVMAGSLVALGLYFKLQENNNDVQSLGWLPLVSLIIFMIAFSIGLGPIPWMLMAELVTFELRGAACSLAVMVNWFLVFLVTKAFPSMKESLGAGITFWIFAAIMVIATVFTFIVIPETKGKTPQEIQDELQGIRKSRR